MWYELVVVWSNGDKNVYSNYPLEEMAENSGKSMKMAFGNQITWWGVRRQHDWTVKEENK